jgi:hypothetical protein
MTLKPPQIDHNFGGYHTDLKLSAVEGYLKVTEALARTFELWYIDVFAGTGYRTIHHRARPAAGVNRRPIGPAGESASGGNVPLQSAPTHGASRRVNLSAQILRLLRMASAMDALCAETDQFGARADGQAAPFRDCRSNGTKTGRSNSRHDGGPRTNRSDHAIDISADEERVRVFDRSEPGYPILARTLKRLRSLASSRSCVRSSVSGARQDR